jgi:Rieske Fe-S protein
MKTTMKSDATPSRSLPSPARRRWLTGVFATALAGIAMPDGVRAAPDPKDPRRLPPQAGDRLVISSSEHDGRAVRVDDVTLHTAPLSVFPADPGTGIVRERSRLNQILLVRFDEQELSVNTRTVAAGGIVAYSGICTHTACGVSEWDAQAAHFVCPCHASAFDPKNRAAVVSGPAPRALPALPLRIEDATLVVAKSFMGKPGVK